MMKNLIFDLENGGSTYTQVNTRTTINGPSFSRSVNLSSNKVSVVVVFVKNTLEVSVFVT